MAYKVRLFNRHWHLPQSKPIRIGLGILLIAGGLLGFLPVLGFLSSRSGSSCCRSICLWCGAGAASSPYGGIAAKADRRDGRRREGVEREGRLSGLRGSGAVGARRRREERVGELEATTGIELVCTDLQSMRQRHLINGLAANRGA